MVDASQGSRKHLKLRGEAQHFKGTFSLRERENFLEIKGPFLVCYQMLGTRAPRAPLLPVPISMMRMLEVCIVLQRWGIMLQVLDTNAGTF